MKCCQGNEHDVYHSCDVVRKSGRPHSRTKLMFFSRFKFWIRFSTSVAIASILIMMSFSVEAQNAQTLPTFESPIGTSSENDFDPISSGNSSADEKSIINTRSSVLSNLLSASLLQSNGNETSQPSYNPSTAPSTSAAPSGTPSYAPTNQATFDKESESGTSFRQEFLVGNGREFDSLEVQIFQTIYRGNTRNFAPDNQAEKVSSNCSVFMQLLKENENSDAGGRRWLQTNMNTTLIVDYTMGYQSIYYDVSNYTRLFHNWTNNNLNQILEQMNVLNLNVTEVYRASRIVVSTPSPTVSPFPSAVPTGRPTITPFPTSLPPTNGSEKPSAFPSFFPVDDNENSNKNNTNSAIFISVSLLIAFFIIAIGLYVYNKKRRDPASIMERNHVPKLIENSINGRRSQRLEGEWNEDHISGYSNTGYENGTDHFEIQAYRANFEQRSDTPFGLDGGGIISPNGSLESKASLLSRGDSIEGDSNEETDTTQIFADEFDQYKDQNLEKMRADIDGNLEGCDGMMNQAVARALIEDDDNAVKTDILWGGDETVTIYEIEASAIGIILEWLKRNDSASPREKREMMQETLNKMTASVRHGILGPVDASRTIHECAGLLGLQLAADIPLTTIVISGMRKSATENDIRNTFGVFGNITVAAVAPNEQGFGILRYASDDVVVHVMDKFRKEELVVEDVAVQLLVIKSDRYNGERLLKN